MAELYDGEGNLVDGALTPEEVQAKLDETKSEVAQEAEELKSELEDAKTQLAEKEAELGKVSKEKPNWQKVREGKSAEMDELKKTITDLSAKITEVTTGGEKKSIGSAIATMAQGNKDLADKIKFHFEQFAPIEAKTEEEKAQKLEERLNSAYILATGGAAKPRTNNANAFGGGGGGQPAFQQQKQGKFEDASAAEVARKLGLSEEDMKEHDLI